MAQKIEDDQVEKAFQVFMQGKPDCWSKEDLKEMYETEIKSQLGSVGNVKITTSATEREMLRYLLERGTIEV